MKTTSDDCSKFESILFALDDFRHGDDDQSLLSDSEQAELLLHIESCEICRQRRAAQKQLTSMLNRTFASGPVDRTVVESVFSASKLKAEQSNDKVKFWRMVACLAASIAVLTSAFAVVSASKSSNDESQFGLINHFGVAQSAPVVTKASWETSTLMWHDPQRTKHFVSSSRRNPEQVKAQGKADETIEKENQPNELAHKPLFVVLENGFGEEADWTIAYLEKAHAQLVKMMDNPDVEPPRGIGVVLEKKEIDGLGGYASPTQIGFQAAVWPREQFRLWITVHELTNLFACHYAGAGGFPSDWWSNGRSPFPQYTAGLVCEKLGEKQAAEWLKTKNLEHADQRLYWDLHEKYGFELFAKFLKLIREDGLDLGYVGLREYPVDDECRSAYTIAYLSIAAGENLAPIFREYGIGKKPEDWNDRHEDDKFIEYSISDDEVERVIVQRKEALNEIAKFRLGKNWKSDAQ